MIKEFFWSIETTILVFGFQFIKINVWTSFLILSNFA